MSMKYLGKEFDIHTGGVDLTFPHHTNEIAQSEGATGKPFVRYWLHNEFISIDGKKIAKSLGNAITLENVREQGISPLAYRYWLLQAHYRSPVNFTWDALEASGNALEKLYDHYRDLDKQVGEIDNEYRTRFVEAINDDLNTPKALALLWEFVKDQGLDGECKKATLLDFDRVLGLGLDRVYKESIPEHIRALVTEREEARNKNDWDKADKLREKIEKIGFSIKDTPSGTVVKKPFKKPVDKPIQGQTLGSSLEA